MQHQAIQAIHAAIELSQNISLRNPSLVHVTCRDGPELKDLIDTLSSHNIRTYLFNEPYKNWGLTSASCLLSQDKRYLLAHLPLWKP